jgi:hypothetical protein
MKIGVYLMPSRLRGLHDEGHMCVWWDDGQRQYFNAADGMTWALQLRSLMRMV